MKEKTGIIERDEQIHPIATSNDIYMPLIQMAFEKDLDIVKLEKLMEFQDKREAKEAEKSFYSSLSVFQSKCPIIEKKGETYNKTAYAKYEDISIAIKPILAQTSLGYRFEQEQDYQNKLIKVTCIVSHKDGFFKETSMSAPADTSGNKNFIQAIGSTITYLKRYTLLSALGIAVGGEDIDGENFNANDNIQQEDSKNKEENSPCSNALFDSSFVKWEKLILEKKKTAEQIIGIGNSQGILFTDQQLETIRRVGKA